MALGTKVKTLILQTNVDVALAVAAWQNAVDSHTFQDDIRVIGCQVGIQPKLVDAALNADQAYEVKAELSRHGAPSSDGILARAEWGAIWTAAIVVHTSANPTSEPFVFQNGRGIDFDDGETIYLHAFTAAIGTVAVDADVWAIVYYIER